MKLVTFSHDQKQFAGAVVENEVVVFDANSPFLMFDLLASKNGAQEKLQEKINSGKDRINLSEVKLLAPVQRPGKFFGVSLNYQDHIKETGLDKPEYPTFFNKQSTCIIGPC